MKKCCFYAILFFGFRLFSADPDCNSLHTKVVSRCEGFTAYTYPFREAMKDRERRALVRGGINLHDTVRHSKSGVDGTVSGSGPGERFIDFADGESAWVNLDLLVKADKK